RPQGGPRAAVDPAHSGRAQGEDVVPIAGADTLVGPVHGQRLPQTLIAQADLKRLLPAAFHVYPERLIEEATAAQPQLVGAGRPGAPAGWAGAAGWDGLRRRRAGHRPGRRRRRSGGPAPWPGT